MPDSGFRKGKMFQCYPITESRLAATITHDPLAANMAAWRPMWTPGNMSGKKTDVSQS